MRIHIIDITGLHPRIFQGARPRTRTPLGTRLADAALSALRELGINKVAMVVFKRNEDGNAFWEAEGFTVREDLNYRNKALAKIVRMDT